MKSVAVFLVLALISIFQMAAAIEPSVILVTTETALVYRMSDGQFQLKGRLSDRAARGNPWQGQPLGELTDHRRLVDAYVANFLDCGEDVVAKVALKQWIQQETESTAKIDRWIRNLMAKRLNDSHIVVSSREGRGR